MNLREPLVAQFAQDVASALGEVKVSIDSPKDSRGRWFLDLTFEDRTVVVEHQVTDGYVGVTKVKGHGDDLYGTKPDDVFTSYDKALAHTLHLLALQRSDDGPQRSSKIVAHIQTQKQER